MKPNEEYWYNLYQEGKIEIDFENGIVYSYLTGKKFQLAQNCKKYAESSAGPTRKERYHMLLHRLIWICANGEIPPDIEINHINGIKNDNRLSNLELVTKSGNALHSRRVLGNKDGHNSGEKASHVKLTWKEVEEIRRLYKEGGITYKELGRMFNVTWCNIGDIIKYKIWKIKGDDNSCE